MLREDDFLIELCGVYKKTGADYALTNISFEIAQGEAAAVLGRRFSGKTAIADLMAGCTYATHGSVRVDGIDMQKHPLEAKRATGYMPQRLSLYPEMTADEYLSFVCSLMGIRKKDAKQHIEAAVEKAGAAEARGQLIRNITRESQQRLALAGALCGSPKALILDEPTLGLDPQAARQVRELVGELKADGHTILLTTHYMEEADLLSDRIGIIDQGKIIALDTPEALKERINCIE
jgi:ABC-2 type transport system ATP-binding protein